LDGVTADPLNDDGETVLDIVQAIGMAPDLSQVRVYIGALAADIFNAMATENIAKQLSVSYTWIPEDVSANDSIFQEFAAQGQSLFAASGDFGAFDPAVIPVFYPAEDPYVTAVGGTTLITNGAGGSWMSETAWNLGYASGGGISPDGVPIPSWQAGVANSSNGASTTLRNVPDVAMDAAVDSYLCDLGACGGTGGGTSAAAPRWAGFMALVNQQAAANAIPALGFINPAIYAIGNSVGYASDFHDTASGNNDCCGQTVWYNSVPGYDLVTGWGSPNGQNLIDALAGAAAPGFTLTASPLGLSVNPGSSGTTIVTVMDQGGFAGSVNLAVTSGLPSGVTASFGANPTTGTSLLTLTVSGSVNTAGPFYVTVTGTSGSLTATATIALTVNVPGFALGVSSYHSVIFQGGSEAFTITVYGQGGFTGNVNLAATSLPSVLTQSWSTNPTTNTSVLTLTASGSAAPGTYPVTITGTSGALTATLGFFVQVSESSFTFGFSPDPLSIDQGASGSATITVTYQGGFTGNVTFTASYLPSGVTASFSPNPTTSTSVLTLTVSGSVASGTYPVTVTGTSGSASVAGNLALTVNGPAPLSVRAVNGYPTIFQGNSGTVAIVVTDQNGATGNVSLAATGLPSGVTASFSPNPTTSVSILTLTASSSAPPGSYPVTITATDGPAAANTLVQLFVEGPNFAFSISPDLLTVLQGAATTSTITVIPQGGFTGSVSFAASNLPGGVTASFSPNPTTNTSVMTLIASSSATPGTYTATVTGSSGTLPTTSSGISLTVSPAPGFSIGASPAALTVVSGTSGTSTISVIPQGGFAGSVSLAVSGLPSGVTATFSANPTTGSSTLTLTATGTAATGTAIVTVTGTSGSLTASTTVALTINASVTLASSPNPSTFGQSVTLIATVAPSSATGTVQFLNGATVLGSASLAGGVAQRSLSSLPAGSDSLTAVYNASTSAAVLQTVNKAATSVTLASSLNPSPFGQSVTFTATVSPASATGTVQFLDGATSLGTATVSGGGAALAISTLATGAHSITAVYSGDANCLTSTSAAVAQTVNKAASTVALVSSANPSTFGQSVTFTATVSPASATGTVQFLDGAASLGTATVSSGSAALAISTLATGAHSITAVYSGDATYLTSTSAAVAQTVNKVATSVALASSLNPSAFGQSVTFTATVSPASATGTVQFLDGATSLGTATVSGGSAALAISTLAAGAHSITAMYGGATNYATSTSAAVAQTVNKVATSVALASSANPSTFGQSVTFTATVSPASATGTVQFLDGATSLGTATVSSGSTALAISTLAAGAHSITAVYGGATNYATSTSAAVAQTVNKAATSVTLVSSLNPSTFGQSVTFTATVSPASATGTVKFLDGATSLGTATVSGGSATLAISTLASALHSITAVYGGATNYATSTSAALNQIVLPGAPTKLTAAAASSTQINLAWTASATAGVTYNVYSSTTSGFTPSAANRVAAGVTVTSYSHTGLSPSTTHYYLVTAQNSAGESAASNQASATTAAGLSCHVTYSVTSQWNNGFGAALTIKNTGSTTISGWNLTWTWPGNQKITQSWNANYTQTGANASLTNVSNNASIAAGATASGIGFNASYSGTNTAPSAFYVNGTLCK
jgi:uncharacterized membrane protein